MKLKVAGTFDETQSDYTTEVVRPLLRDPIVEYVGEVNDLQKQDLLGGAYALLFPIEWPEPFGLVMIESLACGTPVVATSRGATPEVIENGVTGFLADTNEQAAQALAAIPALDRRRCRREFEKRFSSETMAEGYLEVYRNLIETRVEPLLLRGA
jgi:glycosyltransferase involved in cell wall biosynthesis